MTQPESRLSSRILDRLRASGAFAFKVHGSEYMMAGLPDIVGCYQGKFFAFETKMPHKRTNVSMIQLRVQEKIRKAGGIALVICSIEEALNALDIKS